MSGTYDRARRYCNRANECLQVYATSQTPGTGGIYLLIAEHYLLLASSEASKESKRTSNPTQVSRELVVPQQWPTQIRRLSANATCQCGQD